MEYTCPKCGETKNLHFNLDYTKAERPIIDVLCNECGTLFDGKPSEPLNTNFGHMGINTSIAPYQLGAASRQPEIDNLNQEIKELKHRLHLEQEKCRILTTDNKHLNEIFKDQYNPILQDNENMRKKLKDIKIKEDIQKATQVLKTLGIKTLKIGNFGIYRQYEAAGQKIKFEILYDEWTNMDEETAEQIADLLGFLNQTYIYKTLGFPDEGQNTLIFHEDGTFTHKPFTI